MTHPRHLAERTGVARCALCSATPTLARVTSQHRPEDAGSEGGAHDGEVHQGASGDRSFGGRPRPLPRSHEEGCRPRCRVAFAELHGKSIAIGAARSSDRAAAAAGSVERERLLSASGGDVGALPLRDRVTVHRLELIALLERSGGRNPRVVGELATTDSAETLELLIESGRDRFDWDPSEAAHTTQQLLDAVVVLHDATRLRLFSPERLARLEQESVAL